MQFIAIFLIGFSVAWYGIYAAEQLRMEGASRLRRLLGGVLVFWCLSTLKDLVLYFPGADTALALHTIYYIDGCGALTFALLLAELTMPGWLSHKRFYLMALPFVGFLVLGLVLRSDVFDDVYTFFFVSFALAAVGLAIFKARRYQRFIRETYADIEDVSIAWVWQIVACFTVCQLVWLALSESSDVIADSVYYVGSLICWHLTRVRVNRMNPLLIPRAEELAASPVEPSPAATPEQRPSYAFAGKLEAVMVDEELYLNKELTLADLVKRLGTNRTYVSSYFAGELHTTFYEYVNRLRIERAAQLMQQDADRYTIEHIASASGFKSISTFRRAFKKFAGQSPSEYLRAHGLSAGRVGEQ